LCSQLELSACWFERWPFPNTLRRIESDRVVLPPAESGARPYAMWRPGDGIELPVWGRGLQLGRFVLVPRPPTVGVALTPRVRQDALALADRIGSELATVFEWEGTLDG
jgi:hypothetical protein